MTWGLVLGLALGAYVFKVLGLVVIGDRRLPAVLERCLALIPAALIAALVLKDTFSNGQHLVLDARAIGVAGAAFAAWRKWPMLVIILIAATLTAVARAVNG